MQHRHSALVRELPQIFGAAADPDLDAALRIEHAGQHRVAEWPAVMELRAFVLARRIAVRVDVHHADRPLAADRLQDRIGDRVVAADRQRNHVRRADPREIVLDVHVALVEAEAALHRHVTDVGDRQVGQRRDAQCMIVRADALDRAHRARSQARTAAIGDAQVHRHADQRDVEPAEIRQRGDVRPERHPDEGCGIGEWPLAALGVREHLRGDGGKFRIENVAALGIRIFQAQRVELLVIHGDAPPGEEKR